MLNFFPNDPNVNFKPIPNYSFYCLGDDGWVWSHHGKSQQSPLNSWHVLKPDYVRDHYQITLYNELGRKVFKIHRLVLEIFIGPCPDGMMCCHGSLGPLNNSVGNLRWDTHASNMQDRTNDNNQIKGIDCHLSKLCNLDITIIRKRYWSGETLLSIARDMMIGKSTVSAIVNNKTWKHIK